MSSSSGSSYRLRIPFALPPSRAISGLDSPTQFSIGDLSGSLVRRHDSYVLSVEGFQTEEAAAGFLPNAWSALASLTLRGSACSASFHLAPISRSTDPREAAKNLGVSFGGGGVPAEVHGIADGDRPSIARTDETIRYVQALAPEVLMSAPIAPAVAALQRGFLASHAESAFASDRLRTAVDIYVAAAFEESRPARLLTRAMVLEVLAPAEEKHPYALRLLDSWRADLERALAQVAEGSEEHDAVESLQRELIFRREKSIRSRIKSHVLATLDAAGHPEAKALSRRALKAYDARSKLMHEGRLDDTALVEALGAMDAIIPAVLAAEIGIPQ